MKLAIQKPEVPLLDGPQAQGDILILPVDAPADLDWVNIPPEGLKVLLSDVTGHHHTLQPAPRARGVLWAKTNNENTLGYVEIPAGESALLLHSEEHTPNGIAPGCYALHRKRQAPMEVRPTRRSYLDDWNDELSAYVDD